MLVLAFLFLILDIMFLPVACVLSILDFRESFAQRWCHEHHEIPEVVQDLVNSTNRPLFEGLQFAFVYDACPDFVASIICVSNLVAFLLSYEAAHMPDLEKRLVKN